jgi:hypothetical protein
VRSDEFLLHLEVALDKGLDDLVDAGGGGEAERFGAGVHRARGRPESLESAQWIKLSSLALV